MLDVWSTFDAPPIPRRFDPVTLREFAIIVGRSYKTLKDLRWMQPDFPPSIGKKLVGRGRQKTYDRAALLYWWSVYMGRRHQRKEQDHDEI